MSDLWLHPSLILLAGALFACGSKSTGTTSSGGAVGTGVGLQNVKRRLEICYGPASSLELSVAPDAATVELRIPLAKTALSR